MPCRSAGQCLYILACCCLLLGISSGRAAEPEKKRLIRLIDTDLGSWRRDTGEWMIVSQAQMDAENPARIVTSPGNGVLVNGVTGRTSNLVSAMEHGDVEAHIEFMVPQGSNSGVYFQARYEIQILDSFGVTAPKYGDCGGVYRAQNFAGRPPNANASRAPGEWQSFDVFFRAPRFDESGKKISPARFLKVVHNGEVVHENVDVPRPTIAAAYSDEKPVGPLMLQGDHGPVAYRNITIRPLTAP